MKKLLIVIMVLVAAYFGYQKYFFSDAGMAQIIEAANKEFPKELANGARIERLETEPGLRVVQRIVLPLYADEAGSHRADFSEFSCKDKVGKYLLAHGVTLVFIVLDKRGDQIQRGEVQQSDC